MVIAREQSDRGNLRSPRYARDDFVGLLRHVIPLRQAQGLESNRKARNDICFNFIITYWILKGYSYILPTDSYDDP